MCDQCQPCFTALSSAMKGLDPSPSIRLNTSQFQYLKHQQIIQWLSLPDLVNNSWRTGLPIFFNWFLIDYNYTPIGTTDTEMSWTSYLKEVVYIFQTTLTFIVPPAKWSVSHRLLNPVVGSRPLIIHYWYMSILIMTGTLFSSPFEFWKLNMCGL